MTTIAEITKKLEKYQKNGIDFNFYEQEYTMKEVYKYVLEPVKQYYNYYTFSDKIKVIYNKIIEKIKKRLEKIKKRLEKRKNTVKLYIHAIKKLIRFYCSKL